MPKLKSKLHKELNDKLKAAFQKRETEIIEILKAL